MHAPLLTLIVFSPFFSALLLLLLPGEPAGVPRRAAFALALIPFALSLGLLAGFDPTLATMQFTEKVPWIPSLGVSYSLGVDGISLWLVLLTTFLTPLVILAAWGDIEKRVKEFMFFMLLLESGMLGALLSIDLLLFYVFWELMLFPMAFLIGIWGGPRRIYSAVKFVLYTMGGGLLMLIGILYLVLAHAKTSGLTFDLLAIYDTHLSFNEQAWLFAAFALAFAIKVPMFPLHTWLPDAHTEAPTGGSVILAGILLKLGTYGFVRFALPIFPLAARAAFPIIVPLAVIGILYGAIVAMPQPDMKRLVAYSSVSHLGFVMVGLWAFNLPGISGGLLQMINHGLSTGALFLMVGFIYERRHTRLITEFGGLWSIVPIYSAIFMLVMLSSIGLPGLNGFVGEFLILLGAFHANPWAGGLATLGVVLGAVYMLTMYKRVIFGPVTVEANRALHDLSGREVAVMVPILVLIIWLGVYPKPFLDRIEPSARAVLARVDRPVATSRVATAEVRP